MLGEQKFYEYIRRFGFGVRTGIELPGEIRGMVHSPRNWSKISITRIPMGQEVGVTPLQMLMAMATIANGGKLVQPRIVKTIIDDKGKVTGDLKPTVVRQVISPETAAQIGLALRGVVSKRGTAAEAAVPGYTMRARPAPPRKPRLTAATRRTNTLSPSVDFFPPKIPLLSPSSCSTTPIRKIPISTTAAPSPDPFFPAWLRRRPAISILSRMRKLERQTLPDESP